MIAAFGIVWFHSEAPGYRIGYTALPFFLVLLSFPSRADLASRARRLLVPFVVWSMIYGAVRVWIAIESGSALFGWWRPQMVLMGTSVHLWFLPFAFLFALVVPVLRVGRLPLFLPVLAAGLLAWMGPTTAYAWYQWSFALIPAFSGLAFQQSRNLSFLSVFTAYAVLEQFRPSPDNLVIFVGSLLGMIALSITTRSTPFSNWCARISVWVFLGHILAITPLYLSGVKGYSLGILSCLLAVIIAVAIDLAMQRRAVRTTDTPTRV